MKKMQVKTITAHMIVRNEEQWIWYAIKSLLPFMDKILIYDTGSNDRTLKIIKSFKSKKIIFKRKKVVNPYDLTKLREEQLLYTKTDWFMVADGDEVWPYPVLREVKKLINKADSRIYGIVIRAWNLIGDVYHFHPESLTYHWPFAPKNLKGWMNLRVIRTKIPGLHLHGIYPLEAYLDKNNIPLQNYGKKRLLFIKKRYFHMTYLFRSSIDKKDPGFKRGPKKAPEIGLKLDKKVRYPEVFYFSPPSFVPSCWLKQSLKNKIKAFIFTPLKKIKRKLRQ